MKGGEQTAEDGRKGMKKEHAGGGRRGTFSLNVSEGSPGATGTRRNPYIVSAWRGMKGERPIFKDGTMPLLKRCVLMVGMPLKHNTAMTVHGFFEQSANERRKVR